MTDWRENAACRGLPATFFYAEHEFEEGIAYRQNRWRLLRGLAICEECPVRLNCLKEAIDSDELLGIWGGTTPEERRLIHRRKTRTGRLGTLRNQVVDDLEAIGVSVEGYATRKGPTLFESTPLSHTNP